ncbi:MAG TPA: SPOR domain-containing protein [Steroidobacteraceae bacterium]|nr:SPOR domain-containing protein [Steroidobacteraceae bacterium]
MRHTLPLILVAAVLLAGCSREAADWTAAQSANTIESYQEFMRQHPDSAHSLQAQTSVNQLTEDRDWQQAAAADTREAYEGFVAAHADSKWAQEARVRVENLALGGTSTASQPATNAAEGDTSASVPGSAVTPAPNNAATTALKPAAAAAMKQAAAKGSTANTAQPAARPAAAAATRPSRAATESAATSKGSQLVQFGAFSTRERAEAQWKVLQGKDAQLKGVEPRYAAGSAKGKKLYRLQASLSSASKARELCAKLKAQSQSCLLVQR